MRYNVKHVTIIDISAKYSFATPNSMPFSDVVEVKILSIPV